MISRLCLALKLRSPLSVGYYIVVINNPSLPDAHKIKTIGQVSLQQQGTLIRCSFSDRFRCWLHVLSILPRPGFIYRVIPSPPVSMPFSFIPGLIFAGRCLSWTDPCAILRRQGQILVVVVECCRQRECRARRLEKRRW